MAIRVGKAIAQRRCEANLTQEQVAEGLGIGTEAVSRMERGAAMPTVARLVRLAEILSCGADDLLMDGSNRASDQAKLIAELPSPKLALQGQSYGSHLLSLASSVCLFVCSEIPRCLVYPEKKSITGYKQPRRQYGQPAQLI